MDMNEHEIFAACAVVIPRPRSRCTDYKIALKVQLSCGGGIFTVGGMPSCPNCHSSLHTIRQREGLFYLCPGCAGRAVTLPQIRRVAGDAFATALLRQINQGSQPGDRKCPFCTRLLQTFHATNPPLELDACKMCGAVWFDPQEFEAVPEGAVEGIHEVHLRGIETVAKHRLEQLREHRSLGETPDETWKWIPAIFGFPVESETDALRRTPLFTWLLAAVILLISIKAFSNLEAVVGQFGFIPAEAFRSGGLTLLSSFFLHADWFHLLGNLYFLLIFGDNVEDFLGRLRYGLLILIATVFGDLVHLLGSPGSTTPCVGASGGISGIIVYYALQFPKARLGFMFRYFVYFRWLQIPAWGALVFWLLLQTIGLVQQVHGVSNVAATAHLGGAFVGFVCWLCWREQEHCLANEEAA
jgi:membrane associated rhomboid family serine protease/Zn-finger nucleic acid-binding protein